MPQGLQLTSSDTAALFSIDWLQVTGRVAIFKVLGKKRPSISLSSEHSKETSSARPIIGRTAKAGRR